MIAIGESDIVVLQQSGAWLTSCSGCSALGQRTSVTAFLKSQKLLGESWEPILPRITPPSGDGESD